MKLKVHLMFDGCCEEALNFYNKVLGGETSFLLRKKDDKDLAVSGKEGDKISHMIVKMPGFELAGQDIALDSDFKIGNNTQLVVCIEDLNQCKQAFEKLSEGGKITVPFAKTFFTEGLGELTDRFGISWIIMVPSNIG